MRTLYPVFTIALVFALTGCPEDDTVVTDHTDVDTFVCDPVGSDAVQNGLANAPLADDVQVTSKTPQHPGDPGPEGLP